MAVGVLWEGPLAAPADLDSALDALVARTAGFKVQARVLAVEVHQAAVALDCPRAIGRALVSQALVEFYIGSADAMSALLAEAEPFVLQHGQPRDRLHFLSVSALVQYRLGNIADALEALYALQPIARDLGGTAERAAHFNRVHFCEDSVDKFKESFRSGARALADAEEVGEPVLLANILTNLGSAHGDVGNSEDALYFHEEAFRLVETHGMVDFPLVPGNFAWSLSRVGRYDEAWDVILPELAREVGDTEPDMYIFVHCVAASILLKRGEIAQARFILESLSGVMDAPDLAPDASWASALMSQLLVAEGDAAAAVELLSEIDEDGLPLGNRIDLREAQARAYAAAGLWREAYTASEQLRMLQDQAREAARVMRAQTRQTQLEMRGLRAERDFALERMAEIEALRAELAELATKDPLTGLANRRALGEHLNELLARNAEFSAVVIDIDHFKRVNDTYGHGVGDLVLQAFANHLRSSLRLEDFVTRYGGEEFCVFMHRTTADQAAEVVRAVAKKLVSVVVGYPGGTISGVTFSAGVAQYPEDMVDERDIVDMADVALYAAKRAGRNRVLTAGELGD